jgi:hypothetical protein
LSNTSTGIGERWESHYRSENSTERDTEKWFPGVPSKALWMSEKVCYWPRKLLLRRYL